MLAELERIGQGGRKTLVDEWATFLPTYADPFTIIGSSLNVGSNASSMAGTGVQNNYNSAASQQWGTENNSPGRTTNDLEPEEDNDEEDDGEGEKRSFSLLLPTLFVDLPL